VHLYSGPTWLYLPSLMSFCLLRNQSGILYWRGFCMMVTTRSTWGNKPSATVPRGEPARRLRRRSSPRRRSALRPVCWGRCRPSSGPRERNVCRPPETRRSARCYHHSGTGEAPARFYRGTHLDGGDGEGDFPPAIDVRVKNTKNVLELLRNDQRLKTQEHSCITKCIHTTCIHTHTRDTMLIKSCRHPCFILQPPDLSHMRTRNKLTCSLS